MKYRFYTTSEKAWTAMLQSMQDSKESIFIEMYIMLDDTLKYNFIKTLTQKSEEGIKVKLILDYFGSFRLSDKALNELRDAGAEVFFFSHFMHRLHRKIIIVDSQTVFLGGVNIHHSAMGWDDLMLMIKDHTLTKSLLRSFAKGYFKAGGKDESLRKYTNLTIRRRIKIFFIDIWPMHKKYELKVLYREKISSAKKYIRLVTPYFAPNRWLIAALDQAALRGVSVEIYTSATTDSWFIDRVNAFYIFKMRDTKVKFFTSSKMNHAKAMLIDGEEGVVGSQNLDSLSFGRNAESAVFFSDKEMVKDLVHIIDAWSRESTSFDYKGHDPKWFDFILAPLIRILQPFL